MSTHPVPSTPPVREQPKKKSPWTPRRIAFGLVGLYMIAIVIANRKTVPVSFVFFKTEASLFVVLILAIAVGFVAGWLFDDIRAHRRRKRAGG